MNDDGIRTQPVPGCILCGSTGSILYSGLKDALFNAPGRWDVRRCADRQCGLLWLDPVPAESDLLRAYAQYYTHARPGPQRPLSGRRRRMQAADAAYLHGKFGYGAEGTGLAAALGRLRSLKPLAGAALDFSVLYMPARPGARLLEIGCGPGNTLATLQDLGWNVEGVDFDPQAVLAAREKGLNVKEGTLEAQRYPDAFFDAIALSHLIEHVHDPVRLLKECRRVLRSDGQVVLVTPNPDSLGHRAFSSSWRSLDLPRHLHLFPPQALAAMVRKSGFAEFRMFTTVRDANNVFLGSRSIRRTGRYVWDSPQHPLMKKTAKLLACFERLYLLAAPLRGEEIVLIARKRST
jgi:SAM-dependent methyltransferase